MSTPAAAIGVEEAPVELPHVELVVVGLDGMEVNMQVNSTILVREIKNTVKGQDWLEK